MTKIIKTDKTARRLRIFFHKTTECADYAEFLVVLLKKNVGKTNIVGVLFGKNTHLA